VGLLEPGTARLQSARQAQRQNAFIESFKCDTPASVPLAALPPHWLFLPHLLLVATLNIHLHFLGQNSRVWRRGRLGPKREIDACLLATTTVERVGWREEVGCSRAVEMRSWVHKVQPALMAL